MAWPISVLPMELAPGQEAEGNCCSKRGWIHVKVRTVFPCMLCIPFYMHTASHVSRVCVCSSAALSMLTVQPSPQFMCRLSPSSKQRLRAHHSNSLSAHPLPAASILLCLPIVWSQHLAEVLSHRPAFCVWLSSLSVIFPTSIHVAACIGRSFPADIPRCGYPTPLPVHLRWTPSVAVENVVTLSTGSSPRFPSLWVHTPKWNCRINGNSV